LLRAKVAGRIPFDLKVIEQGMNNQKRDGHILLDGLSHPARAAPGKPLEP